MAALQNEDNKNNKDKDMESLVPAKMFRELMAGAVAGPLNQEFTYRAVLKFLADGGHPDTLVRASHKRLAAASAALGAGEGSGAGGGGGGDDALPDPKRMHLDVMAQALRQQAQILIQQEDTMVGGNVANSEQKRREVEDELASVQAIEENQLTWDPGWEKVEKNGWPMVNNAVGPSEI